MIKVLVVDDSATVRSLITAVLAEVTHIEIVGQAATGGEALALVEQLHPDVITMDVEMPDMNGLEATRRIMAASPTPILIITGHMDSPGQNVIFEAMQAGAVDVMAKPKNSRRQLEDWKAELVDKIKTLSVAKTNV